MNPSSKFGIVQGRLIQPPAGCLQWFPQDCWESEFFIASALGYGYIELIAERRHNENNPLWTREGIERVRSLSERNRLALHALCDDYLIEHSLDNNNNDVFDDTVRLISQARILGIEKLILPLFEKSEVSRDNFERFGGVLRELAKLAKNSNILVCLETALNGEDLVDFLRYLNDSTIKSVFDTGNRIAFGHDIYQDIILLGSRIGHVHIKDKDERNENVLLGTGRVNFSKVFKSFSAIGYQGPYTFETFRGKNPMRTAEYNRMFVEYFIDESLEE